MAMAAANRLAEPVTRATLLASRKLSRMFADVFGMVKANVRCGPESGQLVERISRVLQRAIHDECVHVAETRVQKCVRKAANRRKAKLLPEMNCGQVAADDEVELHGAEAVGSRVLE